MRVKLAIKIFLLLLAASALGLIFVVFYALLEKDNVECIFSDAKTAESSAHEVFRANSMGLRVDEQLNKRRQPSTINEVAYYGFRMNSVVRLGDGNRYEANVSVIDAETGKEAGTMTFQTGCEWVDYQPAP